MKIMAKTVLFIAAMSVATLSTEASAAKYLLSVTGKVDGIVALQNSVSVPTPSGIVSIGNDYTLEALFDTGTAELTELYNLDPTINIYNLPGAQISARIGVYAINFSPSFSFNSTAQLWNNYVVVNPTDAQSFSFFNFNLSPLAPRPFVMGSGLTSESLTFSAFDNSATARNSDLISELVPLSAFASQSIT